MGLELSLSLIEEKAGLKLTVCIFTVLGWVDVEDKILAF